jgi:hypothetical protein
MEFITNTYKHKYKHRAGVPGHQGFPQVKCGKVSLRGYMNKEEEEEEDEEKEKENRRSLCKSAFGRPISNCVENTCEF